MAVLWLLGASPLATRALATPGLAPRDRLVALYGEQLSFDRHGEPVLTMRVAAGQVRVDLSSSGRLRWLPRGEVEGLVLGPGDGPWEVRVEGFEPGLRREWRIAARFGGNVPSRTAQSLIRWQQQGHEARAFEAGALLGFGEHHVDTRTAIIGIDPREVRPAGRGRSDTTPGGTWAEWITRPGGWLVVRHVPSGFELRARDLLVVEAESPERDLVVGGVNWGKAGRRPRRYGGQLAFVVGGDGRLVVVNTTSAEEVLMGTVPAELFPNAPLEALKAQAVAARGQLLSRLGTRHRGEPFHLCNSTHCQVYTGRTDHAPRATEAVRATRGEVLVDGGGLTESVYGSACGGHTEAGHAMWGGTSDAALLGVPDGPATGELASEAGVRAFIEHPPRAWCATTGRNAGVFRWRSERTGAELSKRVNAQAPIGPVRRVKILARGRSGRVTRVLFEGTQGEHVIEGESAHRRLLGGLKSGLWVVDRVGGIAEGEPAVWRFSGGGFGHGVGMCQHGALGMANAGHSYRAILSHYYPGTRLDRLW